MNESVGMHFHCGPRVRAPPLREAPVRAQSPDSNSLIDLGDIEMNTNEVRDTAHQETSADALRAGIAQRFLVEQTFLEEEGKWDHLSCQPYSTSHMYLGDAYEASNKHRLQLQAAHWGEERGRRTRHMVLRDSATYLLCPGLRIEAGQDLTPAHGADPCTVECPSYEDSLPLSAHRVTELHPGRSPVRVFIAEGTSQKEALLLISRVMEWLTAEYEAVVASAPEEPPAVRPEPGDRESPMHLTVGSDRLYEGGPRLHWWSGEPFLSPEEARQLAEWLMVEAQRTEAPVPPGQASPNMP